MGEKQLETLYTETSRKIESQIETDKVIKEQSSRIFRLFIASAGGLIAILSLGSRFALSGLLDLSVDVLIINTRTIKSEIFSVQQLRMLYASIVFGGVVLISKIVGSYYFGIRKATEAMEPNELKASIDYGNVDFSSGNGVKYLEKIIEEHINIIKENEEILEESNNEWSRSHELLQELIYSFAALSIYSLIYISPNEGSLFYGSFLCILILLRELVRQVGQDQINSILEISFKQDSAFLVLSLLTTYLFSTSIGMSSQVLVLIILILIAVTIGAWSKIIFNESVNTQIKIGKRNFAIGVSSLIIGIFLSGGIGRLRAIEIFTLVLFLLSIFSVIVNFVSILLKGIEELTAEKKDVRGIIIVIVGLSVGSLGTLSLSGNIQYFTLIVGISAVLYGMRITYQYRSQLSERVCEMKGHYLSKIKNKIEDGKSE